MYQNHSTRIANDPGDPDEIGFDDLVPCVYAGRYLYERNGLAKASPQTTHRHIRIGVCGITLQACRRGNQLWTTERAVAEFAKEYNRRKEAQCSRKPGALPSMLEVVDRDTRANQAMLRRIARKGSQPKGAQHRATANGMPAKSKKSRGAVVKRTDPSTEDRRGNLGNTTSPRGETPE